MTERMPELTARTPADSTAAPAAQGSPAIRPFRVRFPDTDLADLRRRILATNWPERETVTDQTQGVPLALLQNLARWEAEYDFRKCEAKLNDLPQFITEIEHTWPAAVRAFERGASTGREGLGAVCDWPRLRD
ncbi:MAG TPA: epoxide hydrolase N-terminal domain-containing protein [Polyangiaceae bacterium]|nr:epoxide hydrolase N-terminal domain-containing protein [Polyangiaceae bacterium]